jgi:hypothetical protein
MTFDYSISLIERNLKCYDQNFIEDIDFKESLLEIKCERRINKIISYGCIKLKNVYLKII